MATTGALVDGQIARKLLINRHVVAAPCAYELFLRVF